MNKIILMGRLTRDPELRYSNAAEPMAIARYTLAVNRRISKERVDAGEQDADFIFCTAFRRDAEFAERYFKKGQMVAVTGRLQIREYTDNTGQRRWSTEVIVEEQHFAESRASFEGRGQGGQNYDGYENSGPPQQSQRPQSPQQQQPQQGPTDSFFEIDSTLDDDDLPF